MFRCAKEMFMSQRWARVTRSGPRLSGMQVIVHPPTQGAPGNGIARTNGRSKSLSPLL
jgi:hypothetical protein